MIKVQLRIVFFLSLVRVYIDRSVKAKQLKFQLRVAKNAQEKLGINLQQLPVNDLSSWHLAKSQTLTVVSSEQEQNFKSVLEKLWKKMNLEQIRLECHKDYGKQPQIVPQVTNRFFVSRLVCLHIVHIVLPIPTQWLDKNVQFM